MHGLLKIKAVGRAVAADNHIGTDSDIGRHIAAGIIQPHIRAVIANLMFQPVLRGRHQGCIGES